MHKKILFCLLLGSISFLSRGQSTHDVLISGGLDLLKTDNISIFKKTQVGFEGNYFVVRHFSVGFGGELWSANQKSSFVMGSRWYANDHVFIRFRGLIGANDATLGLGYTKPINSTFRFEGLGDYYFGGAAFALRFGVSVILR
ncbi:hypothetical protein WSM22_27800 [Cytophagales bacterium WSM2-2]|nr:hypothetical protein WSM22_27800 [Cytophagales bacterium WSM2-2]